MLLLSISETIDDISVAKKIFENAKKLDFVKKNIHILIYGKFYSTNYFVQLFFLLK